MTTVYRVSFSKKVTDSPGYNVDACQGIVEVHALTQMDAIESVRMRFAALAQVNVWSLRADWKSRWGKPINPAVLFRRSGRRRTQ